MGNMPGWSFDRLLAQVCQYCTLCRYVRRHSKGFVARYARAFMRYCPACNAFLRVHGRHFYDAPVKSVPRRKMRRQTKKRAG